MKVEKIKDVKYNVFVLFDEAKPGVVFYAGTTSQHINKRLSDILAAARLKKHKLGEKLELVINPIIENGGKVGIKLVGVFESHKEARDEANAQAKKLFIAGHPITNLLYDNGNSTAGGRPVGSTNPVKVVVV